MRTQEMVWKNRTGWMTGGAESQETSLVLYFGARQALACGAR